MDNLSSHKNPAIRRAIRAVGAKLFYLPPYAPDTNPDELLNNDLKQAIARRRTPRTKAALRDEVKAHMRDLQRRPAKVRAFFRAPSVAYAA